MKMIKLSFLIAGFSISLSLLLLFDIMNSVHIVAFQSTPGPSPITPNTGPLQQPQFSPPLQNNTEGQPQSPPSPSIPFFPSPSQPSTTTSIPPFFPSPSQPSTTTSIPSSNQTSNLLGAIKANGTINSLINTPTTKWIATGNWSLVTTDGGNNSFTTNMTWYTNNGTGTHTHELQNLTLTQQPQITEQPAINLALKGLMDVGTNHRVVWHKVEGTIDIQNGKTISISLNDNQTNHHFARQPIYGIVHSLTRCSDTPLPNMEVLLPCS
jgi:hypothetical protein